MSGGWSPIVNLLCHRGAKPRWDAEIAAFVPPISNEAFVAAGSAAGKMLLSECLADGAAAGAFRRQSGLDSKMPGRSFCDRAVLVGQGINSARPLSIFRTTPRQTICCLPLARATPTLSSPNDTPPPAWRPTRASSAMSMPSRSSPRPPASRSSKSARLHFVLITRQSRLARLPAHSPVTIFSRCAKHRYMTGPPRTARCLSKPACGCVRRGFQKTATTGVASADREVRNTRQRVGICDVSTLGKIDVQGKDSGAFLDRLYCNTFSTLAVGKARYGLMLREDGIALDDGTTSRLADDHYRDDDNDGECRPHHVPHRVLPPSALAGARCDLCVDHRTMGTDGDRRPKIARDAAKGR